MPKKVATVINVEPKVWFANERTWLAYLSVAVLLGSLSGTLFAGSGSEVHQAREKMIKAFGSVYGGLCVAFLTFLAQSQVDPKTDSPSSPVTSALATLIYGYAVFQKRVTMIKRRSAEPFGAPLLLSSPFHSSCRHLV